jgi:hypothetical protein
MTKHELYPIVYFWPGHVVRTFGWPLGISQPLSDTASIFQGLFMVMPYSTERYVVTHLKLTQLLSIVQALLKISSYELTNGFCGTTLPSKMLCWSTNIAP